MLVRTSSVRTYHPEPEAPCTLAAPAQCRGNCSAVQQQLEETQEHRGFCLLPRFAAAPSTFLKAITKCSVALKKTCKNASQQQANAPLEPQRTLVQALQNRKKAFTEPQKALDPQP